MELNTSQKKQIIEITLGDATCEVTILPLSASQINALLKKHTVIKYIKRQKEEVLNELLLRKERFDKTVVGWKGITSEGKKLECNKENKELLVEHSPEFVLQVFESIDELAEVTAQEKKEIQKN